MYGNNNLDVRTYDIIWSTNPGLPVLILFAVYSMLCCRYQMLDSNIKICLTWHFLCTNDKAYTMYSRNLLLQDNTLHLMLLTRYLHLFLQLPVAIVNGVLQMRMLSCWNNTSPLPTCNNTTTSKVLHRQLNVVQLY